ncbi:hypothetical protein [Ammonifex thiophilus]|uniref:Conjugal transfer protein TrbL n=1 Tax=Ammonifex thiophilus TaxID=444093 RepID=A0A3D8P187_9THEO|nr:hypothetical protein [Ammonifex thiophilus]RDV81231.1 hypothetical protein DXX99_09615 [Ammonifex thiophilus]
MKAGRVLCALLLLAFLFSCFSCLAPAFASQQDSQQDSQQNSASQDDFHQRVQQTVDETLGSPEGPPQKPKTWGRIIFSPFEQVLALPIEGIVWMVFEGGLGFQPIQELVYAHHNNGQRLKEGVPVISEREWETCMDWYLLLAGFMGVLMALAFVASGYRVMLGSIGNPSAQADAKQELLYILLATFVTLSAPLILRVLLDLNNALVDFFWKAGKDYLGKFPDPQSIGNDYPGILGAALAQLAFAGMMVYFNFLYAIRKFVLVTILVLTPFFAYFWAANRNPQVIGVWFGELSSNAFMQAAHAAAMTVFLALIQSSDKGASWLTLALVFALVPVGEVIRNLFQGFLKFLGVPEESVARKAMLAATGLGAIVGLIGLGAYTFTRGHLGGKGLASGFVPYGGPGSLAGGSLAGGAAGSLLAGGVAGGLNAYTGALSGMVSGMGPVAQQAASSAITTHPSAGGTSGVVLPPGLPPGWAERPSGIAVPGTAASGGMAAPGAVPGGEALEGGPPAVHQAVERAVHAGQAVAHGAHHVASAVGNVGGTGPLVGAAFGTAAGAVARTAHFTYGAVKGIQEIRRSLGENASLGEALRRYTGAESTFKAAVHLTAGALASAAGRPGAWAYQRFSSRSLSGR